MIRKLHLFLSFVVHVREQSKMKLFALVILLSACLRVSAFVNIQSGWLSSLPAARLPLPRMHSARTHPSPQMRYVATNRFKVKLGCEEEFETIWRERESKLQSTSGFVQFMILKEDAEKDDNSEEVVGGEYTNYVSYTTWMHKLDFQAWRESQAFRSSHGSGPVTGMSKMGELLVGRPSPQLFEAVLVEPTPSEHEGGPWDFEEEPSYFDGDLD